MKIKFNPKFFVVFISLILIGSSFVNAQNEISNENELSNLIVQISEFESDDGQAIVSLYNSEEDWPKKPIIRLLRKIKNTKCIVEFEKLPFGEYSVTVIHDDNNNSEMDTNFFGIPSEDYGFSNDAVPSFGPAKWKDAKFLIDKPSVEIKIKIQ